MSEMQDDGSPGDDLGAQLWSRALASARLLAVAPHALGGVWLRAQAGPVRDRWLALMKGLAGPDRPWRKMPAHVTDDRLIGGLDLAATLAAGRPIAERGLLAEANGGLVVAAMAERLSAGKIARLAAALDRGRIALERDGFGLDLEARIAVLALDEGEGAEERCASALVDRLAFHLDLRAIGIRDTELVELDAGEPDRVREAAARLSGVACDASVIEALCATALALGIGSIRAPQQALAAARAHAALEGREAVGHKDASLAAALVLAPRATRLPPEEAREELEDEPPPETDADDPPPEDEERQGEPDEEDRPLEDIVLEAAKAALPEDLLAMLAMAQAPAGMSAAQGTAGQERQTALRGRPIGVRPGKPLGGARLDLVATLRTAAPWQSLRKRERAQGLIERVEVRPGDFRVTRFKHRSESTVLFIVDASGSSAFQRLAEAKGAVELLLADCYVRREQVALIAFRGKGAELVLPPTRSLVRAKRTLAGMPGGGGTPLSAAIDAALVQAIDLRRRGQTPILVFLTDGRPNLSRDGSPGRPAAEGEAMAAARLVRAQGLTALLVDTSVRAQPFTRTLAAEMGARYLPLPFADSGTINTAIRQSADAARG